MGITIIFDFLLPLLIVGVLYMAVRLVTRAFLQNEEKKRAANRQAQDSQVFLPLKLQACERLVLYLERISPAQMINRFLNPGMSAASLQLALLQAIREEFEHNVAQQIYISPGTWTRIKTAKEEIILLVNKKASEIGPDAPGNELAKNILKHWADTGQSQIQSAIDQLKLEISKPL